MGLNQPITARGGPLREDGGAGGGRGGPPPEGPRPVREGGAASGPAPNGAAGEEVSVCEPAAGPGQARRGRTLQRSAARWQGEGRDLDRTPCPAPVRCALERREELGGGGAGGGKRMRPRHHLESEDPSNALHAPGPLTCTHMCSVSYTHRHKAVDIKHRLTGAHTHTEKHTRLSPCNLQVIITPGAQRLGREGGDWNSGCREQRGLCLVESVEPPGAR